MALFNFNDTTSRKQIGISITYANNVKQLNADGLLEYQRKQSNLVGSRNEWELENMNDVSLENNSLD